MYKQIGKKLCVILITLCLLLSVSGCGHRNITFENYFKDYEYQDPYPALNGMEHLSAFSGMDMEDSFKELVLFSDNTTIKVYNLESGTIVKEFDALSYSDVEFFQSGEHTFFVMFGRSTAPVADAPVADAPAVEAVEFLTVEEIETYLAAGLFYYDEETDMCIDMDTGMFWIFDPDSGYFIPFGFAGVPDTPADAPAAAAPEETVNASKPANIEVYDAAGTQVAVAESRNDSFSVSEDLFEIGGQLFRVGEAGEVTPLNANPFFGSIPDISYKVDSYYYTVDDESVNVYNSDLNSIFYWEIPNSSVEDCNITTLGDNILVQMGTPLLETEAEYDLIVDEAKYDLTSLIIDPIKGTVKNVELDYILIYNDNYYEDNEEKAFSAVYMIDGYRVQDADSAVKYVQINENTGAIKAEVMADIQGSVSVLANDRFLYTTHSGDLYMMNLKGVAMAKVNKLKTADIYASHNENYFIYNGQVYNYNLKEVYDFAGAGQTLHTIMGHSILFTGPMNHFYLLTADGTCHKLDENAMEMVGYKQFYCLSYEDGRSVVFDENGQQIGSDLTGSRFTLSTRREDTSIVRVSVPNDTGFSDYEYYKVFAVPVEE